MKIAAGLPIGTRPRIRYGAGPMPVAGDGFRLKAGMTLMGTYWLFS